MTAEQYVPTDGKTARYDLWGNLLLASLDRADYQILMREARVAHLLLTSNQAGGRNRYETEGDPRTALRETWGLMKSGFDCSDRIRAAPSSRDPWLGWDFSSSPANVSWSHHNRLDRFRQRVAVGGALVDNRFVLAGPHHLKQELFAAVPAQDY